MTSPRGMTIHVAKYCPSNESVQRFDALDGPLPPRIENRYAWFFRVTNGRISEIHEYLDSLYMSGLLAKT